ncbi:MFS transporter [Actinomyces culturomici]|uniref:MFS transporter n=1 Tax=Actinomyces culturomici TaxID=1926276 RepID=UPI000E1FC8E3|nr:MFS transporter [Actinomyces culturomici]
MSTTPDYTPDSTPASASPKKQKILTRRVVEWAAWDWGSSAFNAVATTFVFTVYLTGKDRFAPGGEASVHLTTGMTIAGIVIALLAPITGQRADRRGKGGVWLGWFSALVFLCLLAMFFVAPESPLGKSGAMWLGIGLLGVGNIFFEFASVNYNAMLNHLTTKENMGRVSGFGWGAGYVGGIVLLLILYVGLIGPNLLGVPTDNGMAVRLSMLIAAVWFGAFSLPVVLHPPKPAVIHEDDGHESLLDSYRLLWGTVKGLFREAPHTLAFLIASAVFRDGLAGVFTFGAVLAGTAFGFSAGEVMIFAIAANIVAGLATIAFGALDDRFGPKRVIMFSLICMVASGFGVFALHAHGKVVFWSLGLVLCVFVGPTQSASRSFLGRIIPAGREGEIFGLYATTGRAVSFLAPFMYGVFLKIGQAVTPSGDYTYWGILGIILVLAAGLLLTIPVKADAAHLDHLER